MTTTESDLYDRLRTVEDPDLGDDIVTAGLVTDLDVDEASATVELALEAPHAPTEAAIVDEVHAVVEAAGLEPHLVAAPRREDDPETAVLPNVRNVVAVASGKGGVGKTTVATNLAAGLADRGARVGILDADVYGPNVPRMLGVADDPAVEEADGEQFITPPEEHDVAVMSMDLLVDREEAVVWRGPMADRALSELFEDVTWGQLDYLVVDLPPGTGDVQLTMLQNLPVTGAVVVTTPQAVATDDTRKGLRLFGRYETPVLGVVENMARFVCPDCGGDHEIFGADGGRDLADEFDVPFLGSLPLDPAVRSDGTPVVLGDGDAAAAFDDLGGTVADRVGQLHRHRRRRAAGGD
ncbi:Mrp/NBP35 family ATP-binding protein [Halomicrococcus gelatinilyticus]|uniref:Mrp/NBP35 family ATP-binding protein n=1 Tax=Halomicrococcus gelatinilyticus TaxID=1702103 RepID=UPI002E0E3C44